MRICYTFTELLAGLVLTATRTALISFVTRFLNFYVTLTFHLGIILGNDQLDTQLLYFTIRLLYTFDIFVNCNWVNTRWQWYSTHLHTNNT